MPRSRDARPSAPVAFSYVRFSSPEQGKGDSLRRQTELRDAWLARSGAVLDTTLTLRDEGVSGFTGGHRENPDRHALAAFLELVRQGRIRRGSYLVVESLDRLSREHIRPALTLLLNLIDAGIRIVQLLPVEQVYDERVEPMTLMMAIMELSRGHSESRMKSERVGRAWAQKKQNAIDCKPITARTPAWLRVEAGKWKVVPEAAASVRRIFALAVEGYGVGAIVRRLNEERVPALGRADHWILSYVHKILNNRAVFGEYQPHTRRGGNRRPDGPPVPNYFPAVLPEDQFHAAQAAIASRRLKGGRPSPLLNLFQGLLRDGRDGGSIRMVRKTPDCPQYVSARAQEKVPGAQYVGFPLVALEGAILSRLREISPADVLPKENAAADRVLSLTGRRADLEGRIAGVKAKLVEGGEIESLVDVLRILEGRLKKTADELAAAQREAASSATEAWQEALTLIDLAAKQPERLRLRSALRRVVDSIWCLFLTRVGSPKTRTGATGRVRLAAVQIWFTGGAHRDYLVIHTPATGGTVGPRPARTWVRSFADEGSGPLDLRKPKDAAKLLRELEQMDLSPMTR